MAAANMQVSPLLQIVEDLTIQLNREKGKNCFVQSALEEERVLSAQRKEALLEFQRQVNMKETQFYTRLETLTDLAMSKILDCSDEMTDNLIYLHRCLREMKADKLSIEFDTGNLLREFSKNNLATRHSMKVPVVPEWEKDNAGYGSQFDLSTNAIQSSWGSETFDFADAGAVYPAEFWEEELHPIGPYCNEAWWSEADMPVFYTECTCIPKPVPVAFPSEPDTKIYTPRHRVMFRSGDDVQPENETATVFNTPTCQTNKYWINGPVESPNYLDSSSDRFAMKKCYVATIGTQTGHMSAEELESKFRTMKFPDERIRRVVLRVFFTVESDPQEKQRYQFV